MRWVVDLVHRARGRGAEPHRADPARPLAGPSPRAPAERRCRGPLLGPPRAATGATVGVYDLGGDTFDATIVRRGDDGFEIVGRPQGDDHLGGVDLDALVWDHVVGVVGRRTLNPDGDPSPGRLRALAQVRAAAVDAKEALSPVPGSRCDPADSNPHDTDATADSTFRIISGYADCVASVGEPGGICTDLDGDGQAGYPDSG